MSDTRSAKPTAASRPEKFATLEVRDGAAQVLFIYMRDDLPVRFWHENYRPPIWEVQIWYQGDPGPAGIAWLNRWFEDLEVSFIFVFPKYRERGVALEILRSCERQFGQRILLTRPCSPEGWCLTDAWRQEHLEKMSVEQKRYLLESYRQDEKMPESKAVLKRIRQRIRQLEKMLS